jgi:hypothetical protein
MDISMIVLVGFGVIDILFKQFDNHLTFYFACLSFCYFASSYDSCSNLRTGSKKIKLVLSIYFRALVGIFNFGNILFYLKAHQACQ